MSDYWETNKAAQLKKEYERKLAELQDACPHEFLTEWLQEVWAPGHSTDRMVQCCKECNKVLHSKWWCRGCHKELIDEEAHQGNGEDRPYGSVWCEECLLIPWTQ